ncbi:PAS domain S-box protein [Desulfovibrio aerotolerans]|uniref:histidine kinase n=1 Tax=Solidesulfovibrio aerotolerans TaxID=295255 RepID=A0A7C9N0V8_9BACT|nr:PAS domain S-box protein [Solidesulfovibrio aerotolerans]MYL82551.1 PAS domain S-box protein [Solidesulfovibrio aerotolerans]
MLARNHGRAWGLGPLCLAWGLAVLLGLAAAARAADILSPEERAALAELKQIRLVYDWKYPPFEFLGEDGRFSGLAADFIKEIEDSLGVSIRAEAEHDWPALLESLKERRADMAPAMAYTAQRAQYLLFTDPYVLLPTVVFTQKNFKSIDGLADLHGLRVGVVNGYVSHAFLKSNYPDSFTIVPVNNIQEGLRQTAFGDLDAFVENVGVASYYIEQEGLRNLRVAATTEHETALSMAVRSDRPLLFSAIQKALANIPQERRRALLDKWVHPQERQIRTLTGLLYAAIGLLSVTVVLLGVLLYRARALRRAYQTKARELAAELDRSLAFQQALRASEEKYRAIFDHAPIGIFRCTYGDGLQEVNAALARMHGFASPEAMLGGLEHLPLSSYLRPQGSRDIRSALAVSSQGLRLEALLGRRDGQAFPAIINASLQYDAAGEPACINGVVEDVAERRQAEEALRESEARYRSVIENIQDMYYRTDREGRLVMLSPSTPRQLGYDSAEELLGRSAADFWMETDKRHALLERIAVEGRVLDYEVTLKDKTGGPVLVSTTSAYYRDGEGRVLGVEGIFRDITGRKRLEMQLADQLAFQQALLDTIPYAVFYKGTDCRFLGFNKAYEDWFGVRRQDLVGKTVLELDYLPAEDRAAYHAEDEAVIAGAEAVHKEMPIPLADGAVHQTLYSVTGFHLSGGASGGLIGVIVDITEHKKMQELMIQTEKMMSVGGLAAGMAHELNNPLGIILQSVQNMERRLSPTLPGNLEAARRLGLEIDSIAAYVRARNIDEYLRGIQEAGDRAARIIRTMLDFSRSSQSLRASCNINALLDMAVDLAANDYDLKKRYDFKGIRIERDYDTTLPPVECMETEIVQVLLNIIKNAAQAMMDRGQRPDTPTLRLVTLHDSDAARIEIRDNGPGMDEATRRRVFEPFFTTKPQGEGTGLGLSVGFFIIAQKHKGRISVASRPGQGTTFAIEIPLG